MRTATWFACALASALFVSCGDGGSGGTPANGGGSAGDAGAPTGGAGGSSGTGGAGGSAGMGGQATAPVCSPATGGSSGPVQAPVLRKILPASWDENWLGSPAVADLDHDGTQEIIATRHSVLYVWNADGSLRWKAAWPHGAIGSPEHGGSRMWASPVVGNFDADPELEIAVGSDADSASGVNVAVYDHARELMPGWPVHFGGAHEVRSITAKDLDNDGQAEITAVEAYHDLAMSMQGWGNGDRSEFTYSPPVLADVDGDGEMEYVLVGDHEHSQSTENRGVTFWVLHADLSRPAGWEVPKDTGMPLVNDDKGQNIVSTMPSPSVGDIDPSPGLDVLAPAYDGYLYAFAADGTQLWRYSFASVASPYTGGSEALLADLNGDGVPEVVFATFSSGDPGEPETPAHLIILDNTGAELSKTVIDGRGSMAAPTVADLDGDGDLELILSLKDTLGGGQGGVQIWDVPGSADNCLPWPTGRGNMMRQGYVPRAPH